MANLNVILDILVAVSNFLPYLGILLRSYFRQLPFLSI